MSSTLLDWAHAARSRFGRTVPVLWLFTDEHRLPDPRPAAARLPRGMAGVVLRHDGAADRAALGRDLACICRRRRLALTVAGDVRLAAALRAGVHLRNGYWPSPLRPRLGRYGLITSSAHDLVSLRRARRAGASVAFLSPVFPTASHPGQPSLGVVRWTRLARRASPSAAAFPVVALGGVSARTARMLPKRTCRGVAAIGALAPQ